MRFNSKSVILNGGINIFKNISVPMGFEAYSIDPAVWTASVDEFNKELNKRPSVLGNVDDIDVDVLRIEFNDKIKLRMFVMKEFENDIQNTQFMLKGKLVFDNESTNKVEKMIIKDIHYMSERGYVSLFSENS